VPHSSASSSRQNQCVARPQNRNESRQRSTEDRFTAFLRLGAERLEARGCREPHPRVADQPGDKRQSLRFRLDEPRYRGSGCWSGLLRWVRDHTWLRLPEGVTPSLGPVLLRELTFAFVLNKRARAALAFMVPFRFGNPFYPPLSASVWRKLAVDGNNLRGRIPTPYAFTRRYRLHLHAHPL
jgi:hypothetical protein